MKRTHIFLRMGSAEAEPEMGILVLLGECFQEKGTGDSRKGKRERLSKDIVPTGATD